MLKTDKQMERIRGKIVSEQTKIKKFEDRKMKMESIRFNKSVKDHQNKQKANFKKSTKEGVEKWKERILCLFKKFFRC